MIDNYKPIYENINDKSEFNASYVHAIVLIVSFNTVFIAITILIILKCCCNLTAKMGVHDTRKSPYASVPGLKPDQVSESFSAEFEQENDQTLTV